MDPVTIPKLRVRLVLVGLIAILTSRWCWLDEVALEKLKGVRSVASRSTPLDYYGVAMSPSNINAGTVHSESLDNEDNTTKSVATSNALALKISLVVISGSSRPWFLSRSIFHFSTLHTCFDIHWIIVHSMSDRRITKQPFFRDVFPWITELYAYDASSNFGNHERNVGIDHVLEKYQEGFVYFLDDDNTMSTDLCQDGLTNRLTEKMYYADQYNCGGIINPTGTFRSKWTNGTEVHTDFTLVDSTDTGHWLVPLSVLRREPDIRWDLDRYNADGFFLTALVKSQLERDNNDEGIESLPFVKVNYNELRCDRWKEPWTKEELVESLLMFRTVVSEMKVFSESVPSPMKMIRSEVSFHEYVHILYTLRSHVPAPTAIYVEIGMWKGASSILMSRHPRRTNVIGIDLFGFEHQREVVDGFVHALRGNGTIDVIKSKSGDAVPALRELLNGRGIDILFIDGDHTVQGVRSDFELYSPLVKPGGFICFDDIMDSSMSSGVREAVMDLIYDGVINLKDYDVIGIVENVVGAGPVWIEDSFFYDWQNVASNEFIIRKVLI